MRITVNLCLVLFMAATAIPSLARAQSETVSPGDPTSNEAVEPTPEVLARLICRSNDYEGLVRALRRFEEVGRDDDGALLDLVTCVDAPPGSPRPELVIRTFENLGRSDMIRDSLTFLREPGPRLRARVALANVDGSYRDLALALGRAEDRGLRSHDAQLIMSHLRPPREVPRDLHERRSLRSVVTWCRRNAVPLPRGWAEWLRRNPL